MVDPVPPALVLGCNTPHGINVLSDWIEEQTGHAPDFNANGFSDSHCVKANSVFETDWLTGDGFTVIENGNGYGGGRDYRRFATDFDGNGDGTGFGRAYCGMYGWVDGNGMGCGYGRLSGNGDGSGFGFLGQNHHDEDDL